jgi:low affinity Fe/Cu permease
MSQRKTLDDRFTDLADRVSEIMGKWWVMAISVVLVLIWLACGPFYHFSDSWQLIANSPTTILELWIGFLLAAATNRVERRHEQLLREIRTHGLIDLYTTREDVKATQQAEKTVNQAERDIREIKADLAALKEGLLR